jgi:hypothetical protein
MQFIVYYVVWEDCNVSGLSAKIDFYLVSIKLKTREICRLVESSSEYIQDINLCIDNIMLYLSIDSKIFQSKALRVPCAENWEFDIFCRLSDNGALYCTTELIWTCGGWQRGSISLNVPECLQTQCVFEMCNLEIWRIHTFTCSGQQNIYVAIRVPTIAL